MRRRMSRGDGDNLESAMTCRAYVLRQLRRVEIKIKSFRNQLSSTSATIVTDFCNTCTYSI